MNTLSMQDLTGRSIGQCCVCGKTSGGQQRFHRHCDRCLMETEYVAEELGQRLIDLGTTRAVMVYQLGLPFVYSEGPDGAAFDSIENFRTAFVKWRLPIPLAYTMSSTEWYPDSCEYSMDLDFPVTSIFGGCGPYVSDSLELHQLCSILGNPNHPNLKWALAKKFMNEIKVRLAKKYHPDFNQYSDTSRFAAFKEAWNWLMERIDSKRIEDISISPIEGWPAYWSWTSESGWVPPLADPTDDLQLFQEHQHSLGIHLEEQLADILEFHDSLFG